jgi:biotin operon repressor
MNYIDYHSKITYLKENIQKGIICSLEEVAIKFKCSERTVKRMLSKLREQGFNVQYCRKLNKFLEKEREDI